MPDFLRPTLIAVSLGLSLALSPALRAEESPAAAPSGAESAPATAAATPPADAAATARAPLAERSVEAANALERQLPQDEQQQLQAGAETFLALWKPANVGEPRGVVILVPASGESADWPQAIGPLRNKLPDAGWGSLSLTLPDLPQLPPASAAVTVTVPATPSASTTAADTADAAASTSPDATATDAAPDVANAAAPAESATTAPTGDPALRIFARIQAAIAFAEQQQARTIVLLGHGDGAYWAARFLAEQKPAQVQHLLVAAPAVPEGQTPPLEELLPGLQLPTGDFFYKDQSSDRSAATRRLHASKRLQHKAYTQVALKALPGNPQAEQEQLFRRMRGWLDKHLAANQ